MSVDIGMPPDLDKSASQGPNSEGRSHQNNSVSAGAHNEKSMEDSFERYYNKDLDLDEGKILISIDFEHITY